MSFTEHGPARNSEGVWGECRLVAEREVFDRVLDLEILGVGRGSPKHGQASRLKGEHRVVVENGCSARGKTADGISTEARRVSSVVRTTNGAEVLGRASFAGCPRAKY